MKKKYLNVIIYSSIFAVAYGSFFYSRYTVTPSVDKPVGIASPIIATAINTMPANKFTGLDSADDIEQEIFDTPEEKPAFSERKKQEIRQVERPATFSSPAVYTYTKKSYDEDRHSALSKEHGNRSSTPFASVSTTSYTSNNTPVTQNYSPATENKNTTEELTLQSLNESDGSEFLPDGSSQQDVFISQSKNPRVYTIKDYQTADISCAPGYDDSAPHAKLMRGLKGCP